MSISREADKAALAKYYEVGTLPNFLQEDGVNGFYITIFCMSQSFLGQANEFLNVRHQTRVIMSETLLGRLQGIQ